MLMHLLVVILKWVTLPFSVDNMALKASTALRVITLLMVGLCLVALVSDNILLIPSPRSNVSYIINN
jgi:hypothetical protein